MPDERHLSDLLEGAKSLLGDTSLRGRRLCSFQLLDYYQTILLDAAATLGLPVTRDKLGQIVDSVLATLPGLTHVDHLRGLRQFRNDLAHNELFQPKPSYLETLYRTAEETRTALQKGVQDVAKRRASMSDIAVRLDVAQKELDAIIGKMPDGLRTKPAELRERASQILKAKPDKIEIEAVDSLVAVREWISAYWAIETYEAEVERAREEYDGEPDEEPEYEPPEYEPDYDRADFEPQSDDREPDQEPREPDQDPIEPDPDEEPREPEPDENPTGPDPDQEPREPEPEEEQTKHEPNKHSGGRDPNQDPTR